MKTKLDYLNTVDGIVRDESKHFVSVANIVSQNQNGLNMEYTVGANETRHFSAGDQVYIYDSDNFLFLTIHSKTETKLIFNETLTGQIENGGVIKKNSAELYLNSAVTLYSKFKPLLKSLTYLNADGDIMETPDDWQSSFSFVKCIEYPIEQSPQSYIDPSKYNDQLDENGEVIIKLSFPLSETAILQYFVPHTFDEDDDYNSTIPDSDFSAVCYLTAGYYCLSLGAKYAQSTNPSIEQDRVNYLDKTNLYINLYKQFFNQAGVLLGIDSDLLMRGQAPSSTAFSIDQSMELAFGSSESFIFDPYSYAYTYNY